MTLMCDTVLRFKYRETRLGATALYADNGYRPFGYDWPETSLLFGYAALLLIG
jgi:hypothetical protein